MTPEITEAMILRVQPGDGIILKVATMITEQDAERLKREWLVCFKGTPIADTPVAVVASKELDVIVIRP